MTIGRVQAHRWPATDAARLIVLVRGYGEHMARRLTGPESELHSVEGARHELFS